MSAMFGASVWYGEGAVGVRKPYCVAVKWFWLVVVGVVILYSCCKCGVYGGLWA